MSELSSNGVVRELVDGIQEKTIDRFLYPEEMSERFDVLVQTLDGSNGLLAEWVEFTDDDGESFEVFQMSRVVAEDDNYVALEDGNTVLFIDGVHSSEVMEGHAVLELAEEIGKDPTKMGELGLRKIVYHHANPRGAEYNSEAFMRGDINARNILRGANRAPEHIDGGFPKELGGEAKYKSVSQVMRIMEYYLPEVCIPLHNAAIGGAHVFASPNFDEETAATISRFIREFFPLAPAEADVINYVEEKAPGVYDRTPYVAKYAKESGYVDSRWYLAELLKEKERKLPIGAIYEYAYLAAVDGYRSEKDDFERTRALAKEIDLWVNEAKSWQLIEDAPQEAKCLLESVRTYSSMIKLEQRYENIKKAGFLEDITRLHELILFYPALMLGHAMRAAQLLSSEKSDDLAQFANKASEIIESVAVEVEKTHRPLERQEMIAAAIGSIALTLRGHKKPA